MLVELCRSADWWEYWACPASLDTDTIAFEWSSRQEVLVPARNALPEPTFG